MVIIVFTPLSNTQQDANHKDNIKLIQMKNIFEMRYLVHRIGNV
jgi:hypothetical protein